MDTKSTQRRYDLDWLRVFGILVVFVYHSGRFFNIEDWHVKNPTTYLGVEVWEIMLANWMMPLIFLISGASIYYALNKGGAVSFIKDKILRLVVPLVAMGMLTFGVLQIYLERLTHGKFSGSFFEFVPQYFQADIFAGWGVHLWYLRMLFTFCIVFLPLFLWLKRGSGQRVLGKLGNLLASPGAIYLVALPTILCLILTDREQYWGTLGWGGGSILTHATFFLSGFLIVSDERLQKNIQRLRWVSVALVLVFLVILFGALMIFGEPSFGTLYYIVAFTLWGLGSWSWVLMILGFGTRRLNFNHGLLSHANEAVLPFYILHQPVLLVIGYFVVQWTIPDFAKWLIILTSSFTVIMALYEFGVRRFNLMRFLFGMKPLAKTVVAETRQAAIAGGKSR
ncbi:MAG: acyltransferase [Chloroflexi bacterium]|nr:acyltransferase [Chloroflexota bacterium]